MRKYNCNGTIKKICCNRCKKQFDLEKGIVKEGIFEVKYQWSFFSHKDGQIHSFDLCEQCYEAWVKEFQIPVDVEDSTEMI